MIDGTPVPKLDINETVLGVPQALRDQRLGPVFTYEWKPKEQWADPNRAEWDYTKPIYRDPAHNAARALEQRGGDPNYFIDPYTTISKTGVNPIQERQRLTTNLPPVQVQPPFKQYSREEMTKAQQVQQRQLDRGAYTRMPMTRQPLFSPGSISRNIRGHTFDVIPARHVPTPTGGRITQTPLNQYFNISQPINESQPINPDDWVAPRGGGAVPRSVVERTSASAVRPHLRPVPQNIKDAQALRVSGPNVARLYDESSEGENILQNMSSRMNPAEVRGNVLDAHGHVTSTPLEHWFAGKPRWPRDPNMRTAANFLASAIHPDQGTNANVPMNLFQQNPNALVDPFPTLSSNRGVTSTPNQVARVPVMPPPPTIQGPNGEIIPDTPFRHGPGTPEYIQGAVAVARHMADAQARNPGINYSTPNIPSLPNSVLGNPPQENIDDMVSFQVLPNQNYQFNPALFTAPQGAAAPAAPSPWGPQHPNHPNYTAPTLGALPAPPAAGGSQPTGVWPQPYGNPSTSHTTASPGKTNQYGNWQEFFRGGEVRRFDVGGIVPRYQPQDAYDYDSFDQQVAAQLVGGSVPRYDAGGFMPGGGYPMAMQQQLAMSEAKQLKQIAEAQGQGQEVDPGYYQRQLMETYMNQHSNPQGQTTPNGVYDPTGQMLMQQQQAAAADQQQGGPMGMINPQIKARVPYYQAQYQKLAQRAASPKGAMKNIVPMKARV